MKQYFRKYMKGNYLEMIRKGRIELGKENTCSGDTRLIVEYCER
jgi:hypothetical protein